MAQQTTLGGLNLLRTGGVHFDVGVSMENGSIAPLDIGDASVGSTAKFEPGAAFEITIDKAYAGGNYTLDNVTIRVFVGDKRVHEETHNTGPLTHLGTHTWRWDGFIDGRFSNWRTHGAKVQIMVIARHYPLATGDTGFVDLEFKNDSPGWFDIDIDRKKKEVDVWLRLGLAFVTGGARQHADVLRDLFGEGMRKYWSRPTTTGPTMSGDAYEVRIHPRPLSQTDENTLDFDVHRTNAKDYVRSHNFGIIDGQVYYNAGAFTTAAEADSRFRYTAAHEFGHTVLQEAGGTAFSWTHKGTTTKTQQSHAKTPLYPPSPAEIDMMNYYADSEPTDFYKRVHASNDDILRLLSLGRVQLA